MKFSSSIRVLSFTLLSALGMSSAFANYAVNVVGVIDQDVTMPVPGKTPSSIPGICGMTQQDNQTIQQALACLQGNLITPNATVTIKLNEDQTNYDSIVIDHPNSKQIKIEGDCTNNPNNVCTIQFKPGVDGIEVDNGNTIGGVDNLTLIGGTPSGESTKKQSTLGTLTSDNGIDVRDHSTAYLGNNLTVKDFRVGLAAIGDGIVYANAISLLDNSEAGISASSESVVNMGNGAKINGNGQYGIFASSNSYVRADNAEINNTQGTPFYIDMNSIFFADDNSKASSNNATQGQGCYYGGKIFNVNNIKNFCGIS